MALAIAFYLLAAVTVGAGFGVISSRNPVHSVLFLILCFFAYVFGMSGYVRDLLSIPGAGEI